MILTSSRTPSCRVTQPSPWTTGEAQATPGVPATAPTRLAGNVPVASVLSVPADAIQMSGSVWSANALTRARMPSSSDVCCSIRNTETTTPIKVPRLFIGASAIIRIDKLIMRIAATSGGGQHVC